MKKIDEGHYQHKNFDVFLAEHPKLSGKYEIFDQDTFISRAYDLKEAKEIIKSKLKSYERV